MDDDHQQIDYVGKIKKVRVVWDVRVMHAENDLLPEYDTGRWPWFSDPSKRVGWTTRYLYGVVVDKGKYGKKLHSVHSSRATALRSARNLITRWEDKGGSVEWAQDYIKQNPVSVSPPSFRSVVSDLLDAASEAEGGSIMQVQSALLAMDEVLAMLPIIRERRDQLAAKFDTRTIGLLGGTPPATS